MGAGTFTEAGFPALRQLLHDLLKLAFREGAQGLSLKGALHSGGQGKLGNRRIVGRLNDRDAVVAAHRDVCPLQLAAHRLGRLPYPVVGIALRPTLLDALNTLRRVVKEPDVSRHVTTSCPNPMRLGSRESICASNPSRNAAPPK